MMSRDPWMSAGSVPQIPGRWQRGFATGELLLATVPLCVIAMVIASKFTATAGTRMKAQWQASLNAQLKSKEPCGLDPLLTAPPAIAAAANSKVRKAFLPLVFGSDLLFTNQKEAKVTEPVPDYYFRSQADERIADGITEVSASAVYVCNERQGDNYRSLRKWGLVGLAFLKARKLFGGGGDTPKAPGSILDKPPDTAKDAPRDKPNPELPSDLKKKIEDAQRDGLPEGTGTNLGKDLPPDLQDEIDRRAPPPKDKK